MRKQEKKKEPENGEKRKIKIKYKNIKKVLEK